MENNSYKELKGTLKKCDVKYTKAKIPNNFQTYDARELKNLKACR